MPRMARVRQAERELMEADELADRAVAGDRACWDELHVRFSPMIEGFARRYCNQLGHRRPAVSKGTGSCPGWLCDRAFASAYTVLCRRSLGDPPGVDQRTVGRLPVWAARNYDDNAFAKAMHRELRAEGRMTDIFRAWCADRGLPQRPRVTGAIAQRLDGAVRASGERIIGGERPDAVNWSQRWLEALHWDAAQTGTADVIDGDRVQRHLARASNDVMAIESMTFLQLAHAVDSDVATHAPDLHNDYLGAARDQTRSHASLDEVDR
jgi:hypothetical protein